MSSRYSSTNHWAPQDIKYDRKRPKQWISQIWNTYTIVPVQILQTQHVTAQLSLSLWCFIRNDWPNDKSPCCTAISSAIVAVIGKRLNSEKKVTLPNRQRGRLLNRNIESKCFSISRSSEPPAGGEDKKGLGPVFGSQDGGAPLQEIDNKPNMALKRHKQCLDDTGSLLVC